MLMDTFFQSHGIQMEIERNGEVIADTIGLPNYEKATGRAYIGFRPGTDVASGDVVINPSGDRFYIVDTESSYFQKQLQQIKTYSISEREYLSQKQQSPSTVFNIGTAYGSVIGTANTATINYQSNIEELRKLVSDDTSPDREQMERLLDLLQMVVDNQVPAQKGLFAKFSAVMEKHSWLSSAVASTLLSWLM